MNSGTLQANGTLRVLGSNDNKIVFRTNKRIVNCAHAVCQHKFESSNCLIENAIYKTMSLPTITPEFNNNEQVCFKDKTAKTNSGDIDILPVVRGPGEAIIKNNIQFWRSNYCFRFFFLIHNSIYHSTHFSCFSDFDCFSIKKKQEEASTEFGLKRFYP